MERRIKIEKKKNYKLFTALYAKVRTKEWPWPLNGTEDLAWAKYLKELQEKSFQPWMSALNVLNLSFCKLAFIHSFIHLPHSFLQPTHSFSQHILCTFMKPWMVSDREETKMIQLKREGQVLLRSYHISDNMVGTSRQYLIYSSLQPKR